MIRSPTCERLAAARDHHPVAADDRGDLRVARDRRLAQRRPDRPPPAAGSTSNSTICTLPSAKTSVCRAAGTPMMREIACAVSCSDETIKSTSSWRSRHTSRYSSSVVRTTAFVLRRELLREHRGDEVRSRRATCTRSGGRRRGSRPAGARCRARAVALDGRDVVAVRQRRRAATASRSTTVSSCSSWSAFTTVEPTCPAPTTTIFIRLRRTLTLESAGAAAKAPTAGPGARSRDAGALRHRLRQRRLLDLLRARRHGRLRARAHAARLHRRRPDLRLHRRDLRRGHGALPRGGRLLELRPPRVRRDGVVRRRVGADARLRRHGHDVGLLRPALPLDLLGPAAREPVGRRRRDRGRDRLSWC